MTKFLTLKHWQLFGLLLGLPVIFQFFMESTNSSNDPTGEFKVYPILIVLYMGLFLGWFYSLGSNLHKKLPETVNMNLNKFKLFLLIPAVYMLFFSVYIYSVFATNTVTNSAIFGIVFPLHLFSMFCIFYCLYFISKELKTVEWQKPVTFSDFAGEFFLIWFFPIGIWIIQPRINKLFEDKTKDKTECKSSTI
ncbi:hypothetical protein [Paludibacter sp.]|uniref:hypothetical protein n=1 Tax=Paludibacter sp. TaxID=1898105 RepID=UPI001354E509|nr:hypothetical protein [Paludibacter sp.]MTK52576.1 hypothetical protein [Paludibacter sp.]